MNTGMEFVNSNQKESGNSILKLLLMIVILTVAAVGHATKAQVVTTEDKKTGSQNEWVAQSPNAANRFFPDALARILLRNRPFTIAQPALYEPLYTGVLPPSPNNPPITDAPSTPIQIVGTQRIGWLGIWESGNRVTG